MSYDLRLPGPLDEARAAALLREAGAEGEGRELLLERGGVAATFLVAGGEVGVGVTTAAAGDEAARAGFAAVLELVLGLAEALGTTVEDPQLGGALGPADADEALRAFG